MPTRRTPAQAAVDQRRRDLAAIHLMAAQLGLDTADADPGSAYRAMLLQHGGNTSAAALDAPARARVLSHLRQAVGVKTPPRDGWHAQKIRTLWADLARLGVLEDPSEAGLSRFVHRMTSLHGVRFLDTRQANLVIESLKSWHKREAAKEPKASA